MGDLEVRWPTLQEYQAAIIKSEANFKDEKLRGLKVQRHPTLSWDAWPRPGMFGVVFKIENDVAAYALKVFYNRQLDRQQRYELIAKHLSDVSMPSRLVSFAYDKVGIRVNDQDYPTLRMDWANGDSLDSYLDQRFRSAARVDNGMFFEEWIATLQELQNSMIAHGDLQHKNILVQTDGTFRLVDYDGMFVPSMRQHHLAACEAGVSAYQHPGRIHGAGRFDEQIDDFSALVLLLTLASVDADLWERYHEDGRLLISEDDLLSPSESPLLNELSSRPGAVGALASIVGTAAEQGLDKVPRFGNVISGLGMEWSSPQPPLARQLIVDVGPPDGQQPAPSHSHTTVPGQAQGPNGFSRAPQRAPAAGISPLTDRQRQVAELVVAGKTRAEIASALGLNPVTVDKHIKALQRKTEQEGAASLKTLLAKSTQPQPRAQAGAQARVLTPRQQDVLRLLRSGMVPEQIARQLKVQPKTLNGHLSSIRAVVGRDELDQLLRKAATKQAQAKPTAAVIAPRPAPASPKSTSPRPPVLQTLKTQPQVTRPSTTPKVVPVRTPSTVSHRRGQPSRRSRARTIGTAIATFIVVWVILTLLLRAIH